MNLIGTPEVAEMLGKDRATIKRWAANGAIPYVVKAPGPTGAYLFDPEVIAQLGDAKSESAA